MPDSRVNQRLSAALGAIGLLCGLLLTFGAQLAAIALTATPSVVPTVNVPLCTSYPTATPRKGITATPDEFPAPTLTPVVPTATATLPANPTAIPTGKQPADLGLIARYSIDLQRKGAACVQVYDVTPGGPAAVAGIVPGDLILRLDKLDVTDLGDLYGAIAARKSGDTLAIVIQRNGKASSVSAILGLSAFRDPNATDSPAPSATPTKKK